MSIETSSPLPPLQQDSTPRETAERRGILREVCPIPNGSRTMASCQAALTAGL